MIPLALLSDALPPIQLPPLSNDPATLGMQLLLVTVSLLHLLISIWNNRQGVAARTAAAAALSMATAAAAEASTARKVISGELAPADASREVSRLQDGGAAELDAPGVAGRATAKAAAVKAEAVRASSE